MSDGPQHNLGDSDELDGPSVTAVADEPAVVRERAPEINPGDLLANRYQIEAVLGRGGSGVVLRAFDRSAQALVAVKLLRPTLTHDPRWEKRFSRELRLGRPIRHPNVCRIFDIGDADGYRFLTMEIRDRWNAARAHQTQPAVTSHRRAPDRCRRHHRRPGRDSRSRHRSSRREDGQHPAHGGRPSRAVGLRAGDRSSRRRRWSACSSERLTTWRPRSARASPPPRALTSGRWASCCTRSSSGGGPTAGPRAAARVVCVAIDPLDAAGVVDDRAGHVRALRTLPR